MAAAGTEVGDNISVGADMDEAGDMAAADTEAVGMAAAADTPVEAWGMAACTCGTRNRGGAAA